MAVTSLLLEHLLLITQIHPIKTALGSLFPEVLEITSLDWKGHGGRGRREELETRVRTRLSLLGDRTHIFSFHSLSKWPGSLVPGGSSVHIC